MVCCYVCVLLLIAGVLNCYLLLFMLLGFGAYFVLSCCRGLGVVGGVCWWFEFLGDLRVGGLG